MDLPAWLTPFQTIAAQNAPGSPDAPFPAPSAFAAAPSPAPPSSSKPMAVTNSRQNMTPRARWKAYYRQQRIIARECRKMFSDVVIYGTGAVEIRSTIPDYIRHVDYGKIAPFTAGRTPR
jgi:hypothetical protein